MRGANLEILSSFDFNTTSSIMQSSKEAPGLLWTLHRLPTLATVRVLLCAVLSTDKVKIRGRLQNP